MVISVEKHHLFSAFFRREVVVGITSLEFCLPVVKNLLVLRKGSGQKKTSFS